MGLREATERLRVMQEQADIDWAVLGLALSTYMADLTEREARVPKQVYAVARHILTQLTRGW